MANERLLKEPSSYLKAAASQPVDWHPWSEEAFEKSRKENKPILLSIGAVWCHWCHVQAHESWEDNEIAGIINKNFVAVKVDRDERPDIDHTYQLFVQMLTGQGGWPLTVFITPDKKPFFGGTYFQPESFKAILQGIVDTYQGEKERLDKMTGEVTEALEIERKLEQSELKQSTYEGGIAAIINEADAFNGGFGSRPKFFMAEPLFLLLEYYSKTGRQEVWKFVDHTLKKMSAGGVYDQIGGGFHRYSVDEGWRVPHFEKMLTDNSLLLKVYLKAYQISGGEFFKKVAGEIINYLKREMLDKNNLFYSSQDADTESEEGKYFTWTKKEIMEVLGEMDGRIACTYYGVTDHGNFEDVEGKNVLHIEPEIQDIVETFGLEKEEVEKIISRAKKILFSLREKREKPFIDKNTFTCWNCLTISAFLDAHKVLGEEKCLDIGLKSLDFVLDKLYKNGKLYHMFSDGKASTEGFLDDYVFFAKALLEAYQITFEEKYLEKAKEIVDKAFELFWDPGEGGFYYSTDRNINKDKPILDFSMPAANSVAIGILLDLFHLTENTLYKEKAEVLLKLFQSANSRHELHKASYLQALEYYFKGPKEFVIVGDKTDKQVKEFVHAINQKSGNIIIHIGDQNTSFLPVFKGRPQIDGKPTVYICYDNTCSMPITGLEKLKSF